jgi:hypothetical protein
VIAAMLVLPSMLHLFNRFSRRPATVRADPERSSLPPAASA